MSINKLSSSIGKSKTLRNTAIAAALFAAVVGTQSCGDKNKGMPVHADAIEFSQKEHTDTTAEYLKIDNNKVKFQYTFDMEENTDWNKKDVKYDLEVNRGKDNKITAVLKGSTYYGAESDRGVTPENEHKFSQEFEYTSPEDFNTRFVDELTRYVSTVMDNLQNNSQTYSTTPDELSINQEANDNVEKKTTQLTGYLKYKMNTRESSVQKQGDEVLLPIRRNDNKFNFTIKENTTGIKLQDNNKENAKTYDITLNGKTITVALSEDDLKFAEQLTKEVEKLLKVGDIAQKIEDEAFLGKGLEVKQLLDK